MRLKRSSRRRALISPPQRPRKATLSAPNEAIRTAPEQLNSAFLLTVVFVQ